MHVTQRALNWVGCATGKKVASSYVQIIVIAPARTGKKIQRAKQANEDSECETEELG